MWRYHFIQLLLRVVGVGYYCVIVLVGAAGQVAVVVLPLTGGVILPYHDKGGINLLLLVHEQRRRLVPEGAFRAQGPGGRSGRPIIKAAAEIV